MRRKHSARCVRKHQRSGAAMVEAAFVIGMFLTLVFGTCDMGMALLQQNSITEAARLVARQAAVHGELAAPELEIWGPTTWEGDGSSEHSIAALARSILVAVDPEQVDIIVEWLDGDCAVGSRVRVQMSMIHTLVIPLPGYPNGLSLTSQSVVRITH